MDGAGLDHIDQKILAELTKNARVSRESGVVCTIEVDPRWEKALPGVETCSHLIVLYWMDRARRDLAVQVPKQYGDGKPTFSLRSPVRHSSPRRQPQRSLSFSWSPKIRWRVDSSPASPGRAAT